MLRRKRITWFPLGARSVALLLAGLYCLIRGFAYLPFGGYQDEVFPPGLAEFRAFIPTAGWGAIWLVIGVFAIWRSFRRDDSAAWGAVVGMMMAWGLGWGVSFALSAVAGAPNFHWVPTFGFLLPATIIALLTSANSRVTRGHEA